MKMRKRASGDAEGARFSSVDRRDCCGRFNGVFHTRLFAGMLTHLSANVTSEDRKRIQSPIVSNYGELVLCFSIVFVLF